MAAIDKNLYDGSSSSVLYTDRRDFYIKPNVVKELYPTVTPFLTFVSNFNTLTGLKDPQFKLFQHTNPWVRQYIAVNGAVTTAADNAEDAVTVSATYSVGLPSTFTAALKNLKCNVHASTTPLALGGKPTGNPLGTVVITTFTNTTTISVKNMTSASIDIPAYGFLEVIGTAYGEGSEAGTGWTDELKVVWNQCGIHRTPFQLTKVLMKAALRGESNEYVRTKIQKSQEHQVQKEREMMLSMSNIGTNLNQQVTTYHAADTFGDGGRTDADGNTIRSTFGCLSAIMQYGSTSTTDDDQNIFNITEASYTYNNFVDQTEKSFQFVSDGVTPIFCGAGFMSYWNKLSGVDGIATKSKWVVNLGDMKTGRLGFNYRELETPHGVYQLVPTPSLTKSVYNKSGFAPGKDDVFHAIYETPQYAQNIKTDNNPLYQKNEYISQEGIGLTNLPVHKMFQIG
jgi:hypothetical protein